jgi:TonB family protein
VLEERINEVVKNATFRPAVAHTQRKTTALEAMKLLFGGGGGILLGKGAAGLDAAIDGLGAPRLAGNGMDGINGRDLGSGIDGPQGIGGLPGPGRGPTPLIGLRRHHATEVFCKGCMPVAPPGYDRDLVLKVVRRHQNEIRFCYESELSKTPSMSGKVTVAWTIGATGAVETAQIAESGLANESVESCIVQRVKRWTFPEPNGGQEVAITFPWVFQVAGGGEE